MKLVYFHMHDPLGIGSVPSSVKPVINKMRERYDVEEYYVPYRGSLPWNLWRNIMFVRRHRTKEGINHITGDIHYCMLGLVGCRSVLTIHDDYAWVMAHHGWIDKVVKWLFWIYLPVKIATKTVFISNATKKKIEKLYKGGNTIVFSHHTVYSMFKRIDKPFNKQTPRILQIGTNRQKNLESTLRVIAELPIKCEIHIIKPMNPQQKSYANELGVSFVNRYNLPPSEILKEYEEADIVCFPSHFEGFGMPIIEGQAVGRPVITTNREPMCAVAGGDKCACLLRDENDIEEYKAALMRIINDDDYRNSLVENGYKNAELYRLDNAVKKMDEIYQEVINAR